MSYPTRRGEAGFYGVTVKQYSTKRYIAAIFENKERRHLGTFDTAIEAAKAYDIEAKRLGKPLNFPDEHENNQETKAP